MDWLKFNREASALSRKETTLGELKQKLNRIMLECSGKGDDLQEVQFMQSDFTEAPDSMTLEAYREELKGHEILTFCPVPAKLFSQHDLQRSLKWQRYLLLCFFMGKSWLSMQVTFQVWVTVGLRYT